MCCLIPSLHEVPSLTEVGVEVVTRVVEPAAGIQVSDKENGADLGLVASEL